MRKVFGLFMLIVLQVIYVSSVMASNCIDSDDVLRLLIKKGIITQEDIDELENEVTSRPEDELQCVRVTSAKGVKGIRLGGEVDVRFKDSQGEASTFSMTEFVPYIEVDVTDQILLKGVLKATVDSATADEAWIKYKDFPVIGGDVKVGKFDRKGESFGLSQGPAIDDELFGRIATGPKQVGIQYNTDFGFIEKCSLCPINLSLSLVNGGIVDTSEVGDNATTPVLILQDDSGNTDGNDAKEFAGRVGLTPWDCLTVGGAFLFGKLTDTDITNLNT